MFYKGSGFLLRAFEKGDEATLALNANNFDIWKTMRDVFPHPYTYDDALQFIELNVSGKTITNFAIDVDGDVVGVVGFVPGEDIYKKTIEIGYWIGCDFWGQGIASEALTWLVNYCFSNLDIQKVVASVFASNVASKRVLEKCGFEKEASRKLQIYKNGEFLDEDHYALFKST